MAIKSQTDLNTAYGTFKISYHSDGKDMCVSLMMGDVTQGDVRLRIHSSCLFGEAFEAEDCDCRQQLHKAMEEIAKENKGVIIYLYQEGRGMGLENKIESINLEHVEHMDTVEAYKALGYPLDNRDYSVAIQALRDLQVSNRIILMCNNPRKCDSLEKNGFEVIEHYELSYSVTEEARRYLSCKKKKLGHAINFTKISINKAEFNES